MRPGGTIVLSKPAANHKVTVGLNGQRTNIAVRAQAKVNARIHRTVRQQTRKAAAANPVGMGEGPRHHNPIIRLQGQRVDGIVGADPDRKTGIHGPVRIQPGDVVIGRPVKVSERAADDDPAIQLQGQGAHRVGRASAWIKRSVQGAVGVQPGDTVAGLAVDRGKVTRNEDLPSVKRRSRINRDGIHRTPDVDGRIKRRIDSAIVVQPHQRAVRVTVEIAEVAPYQ